MTENEASVKLEVIRVGLLSGTDVKVVSSEENIEAIDAAINAIEEVQQYQSLEKRLTDMFGGELSLEDVTDELERYLKEPDNPHPVNAKILTYEDAKAWEEYQAIGTPEECLWNKDFLDFLSDRMKPGDFETYLRLYNTLEQEGER